MEGKINIDNFEVVVTEQDLGEMKKDYENILGSVAPLGGLDEGFYNLLIASSDFTVPRFYGCVVRKFALDEIGRVAEKNYNLEEESVYVQYLRPMGSPLKGGFDHGT